MRCQMMLVLLARGPQGLGLELDGTNTIIALAPGGAAHKQGILREGDMIISVDGAPLRCRLLQDVMDLRKSMYQFDVCRMPVAGENYGQQCAPKAVKPGKIKRALSFDRMRR